LNLYGVSAFLTFDQARLQITGVSYSGVGLNRDTPVTFAPDFDNTNGWFRFAYTQDNPAPAVTGSNILLATITFQATSNPALAGTVANGQFFASSTTPFPALVPVILTQYSDPIGQPIGPLTMTPGSVTLGSVPTGTVTGTITLQARGSSAGAVAYVHGVFASATSITGGVVSGATNPAGAFSAGPVSSGSGIAKVAIMAGYLRAYNTNLTVAGVTTNAGSVLLLGGDATGDGAVDILDLSLIASQYGQPPASWSALGNGTAVPAQQRTPDINGDGAVNILDLSLTASNFGIAVPSLWP
jgi:hypothetical protein